MKKVIGLILIFSLIAFAAINKISYTYTFTGQTSPKVTWLDANFTTAKNAINQTIDSTNRLRDTTFKYLYGRSFTGTGAIVNASAPTLINPVLTTPTIGLINGLNDTIRIADGDTLKASDSKLTKISTEYISFSEYGFIGNAGIGKSQATISDLYAINAYLSNTVAVTGRAIASDFEASDSVKAVNASFSGRITGTDVALSDSVKAVNAAFTGRVTGTDLSVSDSLISNSIDATTRVVTDSIYAGEAVFETSNTPLLVTKINNADNVLRAVTLEAKSTSNRLDGFGTGINYVMTDDGVSKSNLASISAVRNGADNTGKLNFSAYNAGSSTTTLTIEPNYATITGTLQVDSLQANRVVYPIRTINSTGTTTLDKTKSHVYHTAASGTLELPDASGSGVSITVMTVNEIVINTDGSDEFPQSYCSPASNKTMQLGMVSASCGSLSSVTSTKSVTFIDCANEKWCVVGYWHNKI
jgi:hypothetical protein